ncbi:MAG: hypothetical protein JOZ80_01020 [Acidobacteriaceae bacterium]|nr:hypothetical protein [Acidobacteriaceae bacterium]
MFEQELEMEKQESSIVPLLLIVALIVTVVGVAGYYIVQNRKVLTMQEATQVAASVLKQQGPVTFRFHTGLVQSSVGDNPQGPHYKLLQKAGLVVIGKPQGTYGTTYPIELTTPGKEFLKRIDGVTSASEKDGTQLYQVPVAERKLLTVSNINMLSPTRATITMSWNWKTTPLGELLDASGPNVQAFNSWDRATLIQKYGADFYHTAPTQVTISLAKADNGTWQVATE